MVINAYQDGVMQGSAISNSMGQYAILHIPIGHYDLIASLNGFLPDTIYSVNLIEPGVEINISLAPERPPCSYIIGDINSDSILNGLDVTYCVRYFKGGAAPSYSCECTPNHTWYVAGDVNGSCSFTGLDVTYMVRYFKGGPPPIPCPDCPPSGR